MNNGHNILKNRKDPDPRSPEVIDPEHCLGSIGNSLQTPHFNHNLATGVSKAQKYHRIAKRLLQIG
jgi:hypothetical protein